MGYLSFWNLPNLIRRGQCSTLVETGTGEGQGLKYAQTMPLKRIFSVEIMPDVVRRLRPAFQSDPRVLIAQGSSVSALEKVLPKIKTPMIFWLDAHYPGCFRPKGPLAYDVESDLALRLPLEQELIAIKSLRDSTNDIILIDDLRIYEEDQWQWGNLGDFGQAHTAAYGRGEFLYWTFHRTHMPVRFLHHSGYVALLPKSRWTKPIREEIIRCPGAFEPARSPTKRRSPFFLGTNS